MNKNLSIILWTLTTVYIFSNLKKIRGAFQSDIWTKEIDLINHVTNFSIHLQVISILMLVLSALLVWAHYKKIKLSNIVLIPIVVIAFVLYVNTQIDLIRWLEINVFGAGGLLLFTLGLIGNLVFQMFKSKHSE